MRGNLFIFILQPHHIGFMEQFGYNAGAWHLHIWSIVNNLKKAYAKAKEQLDILMIGCLSLGWKILQTKMPGDIMVDVENQLAAFGLPRTGAEGNESGIVVFSGHPCMHYLWSAHRHRL